MKSKFIIIALIVVLFSLLMIPKITGILSAEEPPPPVFYIPQASITIDGDDFDWQIDWQDQEILPAIVDEIGDKPEEIAQISGADISNFYLAHDNIFLYAKLNLADGPPNPNITYFFTLDLDSTTRRIGDYFILFGYNPYYQGWQVSIRETISLEPWETIIIYQELTALPGSDFIELKIPLSSIIKDGFLFYTTARTVNDHGDRTIKVDVRLGPPPPITISEPSVTPSELKAGKTLVVKATVTGENEIVSVKANLGGLATINLFDDGQHQDGAPNDNVYANAWTVPEGTPLGRYIVTISAGDILNNEVIDRSQTFTIITALPPAPVTLDEPTEVAVPFITLSWSGNEDPDFTSYQIIRTQPDGSEATIATISDRNTLSFMDPTIAPNTIYFYRIRVFNVANLFSDSNTVRTGAYALPEADIVVDGDSQDWQSLPVFAESLQSCVGQTCPDGSDLKTLKLAKKANKLYFLFELWNPTPDTTGQIRYQLLFDNDRDNILVGESEDRLIDTFVQDNQVQVSCRAMDTSPMECNGQAATKDNFIEGSVDLNLLDLQRIFRLFSFSMTLQFEPPPPTPIVFDVFSTVPNVILFTPVPQANITIDGNSQDWQALPVFSASLQGCFFQPCIYGSDLKTLKLAKKGNELYFLFELWEPPDPAGLVRYQLLFDNNRDNIPAGEGDRTIGAFFEDGSLKTQCLSLGTIPTPIECHGQAATSENFIEGSVDINLLGLQNLFNLFSVSITLRFEPPPPTPILIDMFPSVPNVMLKWSFDIAVILAEPSNIPHDSSSMTVQPCKLLSEKTYQNGHSKEYYQDLAYCASDYYEENSYRTIDLNFSVHDDNGEWFKLSKNLSEYVGQEEQFWQEAEDLAGIHPDANGIDFVLVIFAGESAQERGLKGLTTEGYLWNQTDGFSILVSETRKLGSWAHEIGHCLGRILLAKDDPEFRKYIIPDLPEFEYWDLMGKGSWADNEGEHPTHMSSLSREFHQWLNYESHQKTEYGTYTIESLETNKYKGNIFQYKIDENKIVEKGIITICCLCLSFGILFPSCSRHYIRRCCCIPS